MHFIMLTDPFLNSYFLPKLFSFTKLKCKFLQSAIGLKQLLLQGTRFDQTMFTMLHLGRLAKQTSLAQTE